MMDAVMDGLSHKPKLPKGMKDSRKHGMHETRVQHNHDGSHTITHHPIKHGVESTTHSAANLEALQDHLQEILQGKPSQEELDAA